MIPSINYHLWEPCNMRCKFCFATFKDVKSTILPKGHLEKDKALQLISTFAENGIDKITFVGGEPTLCPWINELIQFSKTLGLTTMLVTNGSKLTDQFLLENEKFLDWITISIDSLESETNLKTGRAIVGKTIISKSDYLDRIEKIKSHGYRLKINTVVNAYNVDEDFNSFIKEISPERWKVFRVLPIAGQNDNSVEPLLISSDQFRHFKMQHEDLSNHINVVYEDNEDMTGTYLMVDPAGRFFSNILGRYEYSAPILEVGFNKALKMISLSEADFIKRGGMYDWK